MACTLTFRHSAFGSFLMTTSYGRREFLLGTIGVGSGLLVLSGSRVSHGQSMTPTEATPSFDFKVVKERAQRLAGAKFNDPKGNVPEALRDLSYDEYRRIRYRREAALWKDDALFELQFFHLGFFYDRAISVSIVDGGAVSPVAYTPENFEHGGDFPAEDLPTDLGYAGFRIHFPLHRPDYADELAVFLGASYFRILGREQRYGLSARGLAIDTGSPSGEEFPFFREFWIEKPAPVQSTLVVYALLDSRRATGAYRFVFHPGTSTMVEVTVAIFPRADIGKLGIAPLTSMFLHGEDNTRRFDDFRPEVHDSDGLLLHTGNGEWIWRPLTNPNKLRISSFVDTNPRGFGLAQRDRDFDHYLDLESEYHRRPSLWIEPVGDWGEGVVQLVEIPTEEEIHDNIVAFWKPERAIRAGEAVELSYRMTSYLQSPVLPPLARVRSTRIGKAGFIEPGTEAPPDARHFVIDFDGGDLAILDTEQPVEAILTASSGRFTPPILQKNTETGGWRAFFTFMPDGGRDADFRLHLRLLDTVLTETWTYLWSP